MASVSEFSRGRFFNARVQTGYSRLSKRSGERGIIWCSESAIQSDSDVVAFAVSSLPSRCLPGQNNESVPLSNSQVATLTTVKSRDKDDLIVILQLIVSLSLQLPVSVVHNHQDPRASYPSQE